MVILFQTDAKTKSHLSESRDSYLLTPMSSADNQSTKCLVDRPVGKKI